MCIHNFITNGKMNVRTIVICCVYTQSTRTCTQFLITDVLNDQQSTSQHFSHCVSIFHKISEAYGSNGVLVVSRYSICNSDELIWYSRCKNCTIACCYSFRIPISSNVWRKCSTSLVVGCCCCKRL